MSSHPSSSKDSRTVKTQVSASAAAQPLAMDPLAIIQPASAESIQASMTAAKVRKGFGKAAEELDEELAQVNDVTPAGEPVVVADASDAVSILYEPSAMDAGEELIQVAQAEVLLDDPPALAGLTGAQLGIGALVLGGVVIASNNDSGGGGGVTPSNSEGGGGGGGGGGSGGPVTYETTYRLTPKTDSGTTFDASAHDGPVLFDARLAESSENFVFNVKKGFTKDGANTVKLTLDDGSYIEIDLGSVKLGQHEVAQAIVDYFNGSTVTVHNSDGSVKATYTSGFGAFSVLADGLGEAVYVVYDAGTFANLSTVEFDTTARGGKSPTGSVVGSDVEGLYLNTLTDGDALIGSKSDVDGLQAQLLSGTTTTPTSIESVEQFFLTSVDADHGKPATLDMSNVTGATEIWNVESNANLVVNHVQNQVAVGLDGVSGNMNFDVAYANDATFGEDATQLVIIRDSGVIGDAEADPVIDPAPVTLGIEGNSNLVDLDLLAAGDSNLMLRTSGGSDLANLETLHISSETEGDATGHLLLRAENNFANLQLLDVTGYGGSLDIDVSGTSVLDDVNVGLGNLKVQIQANDNHTTAFDFLGEDIGDIEIAGFDVDNTDDADEDVLDLSGFSSIADMEDLTMTDVTGGVQITFGTAASGMIMLDGVSSTDLKAVNFNFA